MENQAPQPNRPKSQIYLQRAADQAAPPGSMAGGRNPTRMDLPAVRPALPVPVARSSATQRCPSCGAVQPASTSVCMACGAFILNKSQKKIRCRRCGTQASAGLVLCPGCGRELQAAPPRIGLFLASLVIVALFLVLLTRAVNFQPVSWAQAQAAAGLDWLRSIGAQLDPQVTINTVPINPVAGESANSGLFGLGATATTGTPAVMTAALATTAPLTTSVTTTTGTVSNGFEPIIAERTQVTGTQLTDVVATATVIVPTVAATATASPVATATAVATSTVAPTPGSTATATPLATPQTLLVAGATEASSKGTLLQPTATFAPTATAAPTTIPSPTTAARVYAVRAGDTPFAIATQFDISVLELLAANGMGLDDARRLRVGQELIIPDADGAAAATATPSPTVVPPTATATAGPPTLTPTATAPTPTATSAVRLSAPQLRSPEPNSFLSCRDENTLIWLAVPFMRESDQYRLHLGFLNGYNNGVEEVTWVLAQLMPANASLWRMDEGLCGLAPQSTGRQWRWYVEVVDTTGSEPQPVSPPSPIWGFSWN